jgi:hypothetical protein
MEIANLVIQTANSGRPAELRVRVGADVTLLVKDAPAEGGRGVVSLAGVALPVLPRQA